MQVRGKAALYCVPKGIANQKSRRGEVGFMESQKILQAVCRCHERGI